MSLRSALPEPGRTWIVAAIAWVGLGFTFAPALGLAVDGATPPLRIGAQVAFWALFLAGTVAVFVPRPWGLVALRLGGWLVAVAGIVLAVATDVAVLWRVLACASGIYTLALQLAPAVGDRQMDAVSYPGERRFGFRFPREAAGGIALAVAVPTAAAACVMAALAASGPARIVAAGAALVLAAASVPAAMQLHLLARRWLILAPRTMIVHDPYRLSQPFAIPYGHITDVAAVEGARGGGDPDDTKGLLDLRSGWHGTWIQSLHDAIAEPPQPRPLPARFERLRPVVPKIVIGVAWPVTDVARCLRACAVKGLPVDGLVDVPGGRE